MKFFFFKAAPLLPQVGEEARRADELGVAPAPLLPQVGEDARRADEGEY